MAMEEIVINWMDPRLIGAVGRRKKSATVLFGDLKDLAEAVNTMRYGHGIRRTMDSPGTGDKVVLAFNHTSRDLKFGHGISARFGSGTVTWKLTHGVDLNAMADIQTFVTADDHTGSIIPPSDLEALDDWEQDEFLVLEIVSTTGSPTQFFVDLIIDS